MLNTILKAGRVLSLFSREQPEWGIREMAEAMGIAKSSAHDLMSSLASIGLLSQTDDRRYRLGWKLVELSEALLATTELRAAARDVMQELIDTYQETLHLAILDRGKVVYLDKLEGRQAIRVELTGLGTRLYPHCSALGKVLLAHLAWDEVETLIDVQGLPGFTDNTITEPSKLRDELAKTREQGYAFDIEEIVPDLCCVAAPIQDHTGRVIAAISMSVPAYRFQRSCGDFQRAIVHSGKIISRQLGYYAIQSERS
jgi:IclR family transcriptional regulator, KDG regulon repressor